MKKTKHVYCGDTSNYSEKNLTQAFINFIKATTYGSKAEYKKDKWGEPTRKFNVTVEVNEVEI